MKSEVVGRRVVLALGVVALLLCLPVAALVSALFLSGGGPTWWVGVVPWGILGGTGWAVWRLLRAGRWGWAAAVLAVPVVLAAKATADYMNSPL